MADDVAAAAAAAAAEATAIRIATATAAAIASAGPPAPPSIVLPKRGGIHSMYGVYIGGSPLGDDYLPTKTLSYHFSSQRRHVKTIGTIESNLIKARDSTTTLKFNGQLEAVVRSATEIGKEKFLVMLKRKIEEHGQETFYYIQNDGKVVDLIDQIHNFTVEQVTTEFNRRLAADPSTNEAYDAYELDEITMPRTLVESLVSAEFYEKIFIRYGHQDDFQNVPGSVLVSMALETCNASVSHDIDGAAKAFEDLSLETYPGENITNLTTEALNFLKIMQGGYALSVHTGSRLLMKVTKTSSEEFNRKVFALLDPVKEMEYKYKVLDPKAMKADPDYKTYGPVALISTLQQAYGRLIASHDWPALALKLPESNNASSTSGGDSRKCFRCQGDHLIKDCPLQIADNKKKDKTKDTSKHKAKKEHNKDKDKTRTTTNLWPRKLVLALPLGNTLNPRMSPFL